MPSGIFLDLKYATELDRRKEDIKEKIEKLSSELAKSPEVMHRLLEALALLRHEEDDKNT